MDNKNNEIDIPVYIVDDEEHTAWTDEDIALLDILIASEILMEPEL